MVHPWQVRTSYYLLGTLVEEAVVALDKLLVSLPKVDHVISDLWYEEVLLLELVRIDQMVSWDVMSDLVDILFSKLHDLLLLFTLLVHIVVKVGAENAHSGIVYWFLSIRFTF